MLLDWAVMCNQSSRNTPGNRWYKVEFQHMNKFVQHCNQVQHDADNLEQAGLRQDALQALRSNRSKRYVPFIVNIIYEPDLTEPSYNCPTRRMR
jgi:hypothetical protein